MPLEQSLVARTCDNSNGPKYERVSLVLDVSDSLMGEVRTQTVKFLWEVKECAERGELKWLKQHGKVYAAVVAA